MTGVDNGGDDDDRPRPNMKYNKNVKDELRSVNDIRKSRKTKESMKLKNMKKDKRTSVIGHMKKKKSESASSYGGGKTKAGSSRKVKAVFRR